MADTAFQLSASGRIETTASFGHNMVLLMPALIIVSSCNRVVLARLYLIRPAVMTLLGLFENRLSPLNEDRKWHGVFHQMNASPRGAQQAASLF
jgi:hypothetical protein